MQPELDTLDTDQRAIVRERHPDPTRYRLEEPFLSTAQLHSGVIGITEQDPDSYASGGLLFEDIYRFGVLFGKEQAAVSIGHGDTMLRDQLFEGLDRLSPVERLAWSAIQFCCYSIKFVLGVQG
ncbi:MAG: hypothetical protein JO364_05110, partial [Pseudonocardiales bacterium]|nr:hypothetical protein [Pseudonocardiales bacterium]MBV9029688.1 hypothetical protein [Pseudonocardiales bacterium]